MAKKRFWSRLKPRIPGEDEPTSRNVRRAAGAVDKLTKAIKWLTDD